MMSEQQVLEAHNTGVEIGSHTVSHPLIGNIENPEVIFEELHNSKHILSKLIGTDITTLAYPMGSSNEISHEIAKKCGYNTLLLTGEKSIRLNNLHNYDNIFPRFSMYHNSHLKNLIRLSKSLI